MHVMYFTEQPMSRFPTEEAFKQGQSVLLFSNKYFDPEEGSRLYNERMDEYVWAEECGFEGIMLNEHHDSTFCMQARTNIFCTVLAAKTEKVKIVPLGNVLPITDHPVMLAEELGMIDMLSKGRLVSGFVRGGGAEQLATNANPAYNRERFEEGHDLVVKAWTTPGPFRWEGVHYQERVVNPWTIPVQKPHPPIWIPGVNSQETVIWAAKHRYPYLCLQTPAEQTRQIWKTYAEAAAEAGYTPGTQHHGYLIRCHVQDTHDKAKENARQFQWMQGAFTGIGDPVLDVPLRLQRSLQPPPQRGGRQPPPALQEAAPHRARTRQPQPRLRQPRRVRHRPLRDRQGPRLRHHVALGQRRPDRS